MTGGKNTFQKFWAGPINLIGPSEPSVLDWSGRGTGAFTDFWVLMFSMLILVPWGSASGRATSAPVALTVWVAPSIGCALPATLIRTGTRSSTRCARRRSSEVSGRVNPGFGEFGAYCRVVAGCFTVPYPKNPCPGQSAQFHTPSLQDEDSLSKQ